MSALDLASASLIWRVAAPGVLPQYGTATSPLVDGTSVIAHVGGDESGALTAFDAATGTARWQWTGDGPGYGSPIIATFGGVRQVVAQTQKFLIGLNATNGTLLWQVPFRTEFDQNAFTPIVFQDLVINGGIDKPLTALRPRLDGGEWIAETVWTNLHTPMFMSSPVLIGGTVYGLTQRSKGQFVAIDAASGKTLWNTQGREGENASILGSRSWLLASTTDGNLGGTGIWERHLRVGARRSNGERSGNKTECEGSDFHEFSFDQTFTTKAIGGTRSNRASLGR